MRIFKNEISNRELRKVIEVLDSCELGFGKNVPLLESRFKPFSKKEYNVATNSASAAAFIIFSLVGSFDSI